MVMQANNEQPEGEILLIDKPLGWTSFDVVKKVRNILSVKVGHAGTLDPLATGLLILCTGRMTKKLDSIQAQEKEYTGKMIIGQSTPSVDLETEVDKTWDISGLTEEAIHANVTPFLGDIQQVPPIFSAVRHKGQRAYKKARKGQNIELGPRSVHIKEFTIEGIDLPEIHFRVVCSKGTYIRSLVRDFGEHLGMGAYLAELRRTRIGEYDLKNAHLIEEIAAK